MARHRPNAPPARKGVSPSCVVLPAGPWPTLLDFLLERFPSVPPADWRARLEAGEVVDAEGQTASAHDAPTPGRRLYYYRSVPAEPRIPFEATVLWQDEHLLVVDKPHFLPVIPSGKYVQETLLVRLKAQLGLDALSPIHRIDRDTAGLVLFSVNPATRNAYQALFRDRVVDKTYQCIAPSNPALPWPIHRESRIGQGAHFMQQAEVPGPVNAITDIDVLETHGAWARYQLRPLTGQRHQLRVHMAALGLPLLFDGIYPTLTPEDATDYRRPLQLLAQHIAFTDPITGEARSFASQRSLLTLQNL
ncbi:pseudouridine synthase [Rhodoferax sp. TH121]|uniref:pseudouridine synthase n=1 Tax=Rhodoferax sp. TH121 TaxID=2022803 RepID=UPI000B966B1B|nr:pseudouridine synthase [Rhodoferax sp. TH121]OYQ40074.1 pseudouridine synthase [Rhodoferax sp. TH121]